MSYELKFKEEAWREWNDLDGSIRENGYEQNSAQFDVKPRPIWHCDKKLMASSHPGVNADTRRVGNVSG